MAGPRETAMNYLRTAMLLAGLTALFMGVGYLIGGATGAMIALVVAAAAHADEHDARVLRRSRVPRRVAEHHALGGADAELADRRGDDVRRGLAVRDVVGIDDHVE